MKQLLLAASVLALSAGSAAAQDATYDWSGAYIGAQIGYGWADSTLNFNSGALDYVVPVDPDGFIGGVYGGYNFQFGNGVVAGIESDLLLSGIGTDNVLGINGGTTDPSYRFGSDQKWNASLRARLGYGIGRVLPFVTAGVALASYEHFETRVLPFSEKETYTGWTIGAGVDYAATDNLIVRFEYRHSDFGSNSFAVPGWVNHKVDIKTHDLRFGIAYKF